MKTCPVCGARAFDDAVTCYGCLHRFEGDLNDGDESLEDAVWHTTASVTHVDLAPEFIIRFSPSSDSAGKITWACAVEVEPDHSSARG